VIVHFRQGRGEKKRGRKAGLPDLPGILWSPLSTLEGGKKGEERGNILPCTFLIILPILGSLVEGKRGREGGGAEQGRWKRAYWHMLK